MPGISHNAIETPLRDQFNIFDAISATETSRLPKLPQHAHSVILEIIGGASADFTLDIEGKVNNGGTYTAVDYVEIGLAGAAALANAQLTVNDQTVRFYLIPNAYPYLRLVATRTAGTLTIHGSHSSETMSQWFATSVSGGQEISGDIAHDAADSGNAVKIGGRAQTDNPTVVNNDDRVDAYFDGLGKLGIFIGGKGSTQNVVVDTNFGDADALTNNGLTVSSRLQVYNESSLDRVRGNTEITVLATASRTDDTNSADLTNYNHRGVIITLNVTTDPGSGETLQLIVEHKDGEASVYEVLLDDGAQATPGTRSVIIYPGTAGSGNDITSTSGYPLGRTWRVRVVHSASGTWAYTVGASMIL